MRLMRGFTLIELLVIVSIISLLAVISMTYMQGPKQKAKNVAFQSSAKAVQSAAGVCCGDSAASLQAILGGPVCSPSSNSILPTGESIGSIEIIRNCSAEEGFNIRVTPGTKNHSGQITAALCDRDGCDFIFS